MASLGTINFLGGLTNAYGRVLASNQAQGEDLARMGLQHQWQQSDQSQAQAADAARLTQQESFDTTRQTNQNTYEAGQRQQQNTITGNEDADAYLQNLQEKYPGMTPDFYQRAASSYVNPVTGEGIAPDRIAKWLYGPSGQPPTTPGKTTTQLTPAGRADFQAIPQGGPGLSPDAGLSQVRGTAPGALGAFTMDLLRRSVSPQGANPASPVLGVGGPTMPPRTGPLTQQVQGAATPDKTYQPFPLTPIQQSQVDYESGRTLTPEQKYWKDYYGAASKLPPGSQGSFTQQYNASHGTSYPVPGQGGTSFYVPDVKTTAQIANLTDLAQYRKLSTQDREAFNNWRMAHGNQSQTDIEAFRTWEMAGGRDHLGIYGLGPQYDKIVARRAAIKSKLAGLSDSLSAQLGQGTTPAQQKEMVALQAEDRQLNQRQYQIQRQGPPKVNAAPSAGGGARQNPDDPITIKGVTKTRSQWQAQLQQMQGGAQ